jgi:hypothetical protein
MASVTGYTSPVVRGEVTTLSDFAFRCARVIGYFYDMRDEDGDVVPSIKPPNTYHTEKKLAIKKDLEAILNDPVDALLEQYRNDCCSVEAGRMAFNDQCKLESERIQAMKEKVLKWEVPPEVQELKKFMLQQLDITESTGYDTPYIKPTFDEWRKSRIEQLQRDLEYHSQEEAKSLKHAEVRNQWLSKLQESLDKNATSSQESAT